MRNTPPPKQKTSRTPALHLTVEAFSRRRCAVRFMGRSTQTSEALIRAVHTQAEAQCASWNLAALDGITLTDDLNKTVHRLCQSSSSPALSVKRKVCSVTVSAGCVVAVRRRTNIRRHVVLDIAYLEDLLTCPMHESMGANIVAHELGHVAFFRWRTLCDWNTLVKKDNWRDAAARELVLSIWDEYAACRVSAFKGDRCRVAINFLGCLASTLAKGLPRLLLFTRKHWSASAAAPSFVRALCTACVPLVSAAYLLGHLDGVGIDKELTEVSVPARQSALVPCWQPLRSALQDIWLSAGWLAGPEDMEPLAQCLRLAVNICGGERIL